MTEFDVRVTKRNQRSDTIIDGLLKESKKRNRPRVEINLVDKVLRPFVHTLNACEIHSVDPVQVHEATTAVTSTMLSELAMRTVPQGNPTLIHAWVRDTMEDLQTTLLGVISANFGVTFEVASTPAQDPPAGTTVQ